MILFLLGLIVMNYNAYLGGCIIVYWAIARYGRYRTKVK